MHTSERDKGVGSTTGKFTALVNSSEQPSSAAHRLAMSNRLLDLQSFCLIWSVQLP